MKTLHTKVELIIKGFDEMSEEQREMLKQKLERMITDFSNTKDSNNNNYDVSDYKITLDRF